MPKMTAKSNLRLVHSANSPASSFPIGQLRAVPPTSGDHDPTVQLVRDLTWFSARAEEIGRPKNLTEQKLLERYRAMISHRRARLLWLRRTVA